MFPSQPVTVLRRVSALGVTLFGVAALCILGRAEAPPHGPTRIIVKVGPSLAKELESALPLQTMELAKGTSGNSRVEALLSKSAASKIRPTYPDIVRAKKKHGWSDGQIATAIQQRFPARARRNHAGFHPPEISRTYVLELDPNITPSAMAKLLDTLRHDADVEFAEPDHIASTNFTPNDPYFLTSGSWGQPYDDLWGIKKIGSPAAWDTTAGAGVVVAVVDTGLDYNHPDIAANVWTNPGETAGNGTDDDSNGYVDDVRGWDFIGHTYTNPTQSDDPLDHFGHGTHVAGTIAAEGNNGIGVIGLAWQAKIMPVKGLDDSGYGLDSTLGPAILYAANNGADVISNSWSGPGSSQTIAEAIDYAHNLGAVIVVAAGNNSDDARNYYPGNLWDAITVSATDPYDNPAYFTNYGSKIDVAAPGIDILSLRAAGTSMGNPVDANYTRADGTSMATPHVSGLAALILAQNPAFSNEDVRQALRHTATVPFTNSGFDVNYGYGRINAATAVNLPGVLESKISSPGDGTAITAPAPISGYARGTGFASYTLEYGSGTNPSAWTTIQTGTSPVAGTVLGTFDSTVVPDGVYTIRLVASDLANNSYFDRIQLTVKYVSINTPKAPAVPNVASEFKPGSPLSIVGTASGPSFGDFRLEWAEGINPPSGWSSTGMSLTNGGASPVSNALVGTWDTSSIAVSDYYTIRLSVDNAGFTSQTSTLVYLEPSLISSSWPISLNQAPSFSSGVVPALDGSNNVRLTWENPVYANTTIPAQFWAVSADGSSKNVTPISWGDMFQPAAGSFDASPGEQAIVSEANDLRVFRADNSSYALTPPISANLQYASVILEDLNNDSHLEAIAMGRNVFGSVAYVFAWQGNGTQLNANFPITVPDQNNNLWYLYCPRVLVGDVNGDGYNELVVLEGTSSTNFTLGLFAHDGTPLTWSAPTFSGTPSRMALADLDHNGKLEIILTLTSGTEEMVHVFEPDGSERPGWPVNLPYSGALSSMAVGSLQHDGRDQIVVSGSGFVHVLNSDGTSFSNAWPLYAGNSASFGPVVLADINGDGRPEILFAKATLSASPSPLLTALGGSPAGQAAPESAIASATPPQYSSEKEVASDGSVVKQSLQVQSSVQSTNGYAYYEPLQLQALRPDGSLVRFWSLPGIDGNQPNFWVAPTVGDFNHDGLSDIAAVYYTVAGGGISGYLNFGAATVLTTGTSFNPAANDWPMISQNPRNTTVYRPALNLSIVSPANGANVSGMVALTAKVSDKSGAPVVQFQIDGTNVGGSLSSAPYTFNWDASTVSLGTHVITAAASDSSGNNAVSPPITVTVTVAAVLLASPTSLDLGSVPIGLASAPQTVTITNSGQATYAISAVNVAGDFAQSGNCVGSLAPGATCTASVTFTPTVRGAETGSLLVSGNFPGPAPTVALSGTGQSLSASLSPSSLTFQPRPLNSTSPAQTMTYSNTGDAPVAISSIAASGDFAQTNTCGSSIAAGASCSISVTFIPTARGTRTGSITVAGSLNTMASLTGTGQAMLVAISPLSLSFGNQPARTTSAPQTVTLSNTGDLPFSITGWSNGQPFSVSGNTFGNVNPGSAATFTVTFAPTTYGNFQTNLTINGTFPGAPAAVSLSGTGQDTAGSTNPIGVGFQPQFVGTTSSGQAIVVNNIGNLPLTVSSVQIVAGDFLETNNCSTIAVGGSCTVTVSFAPTTRGAQTGLLTIFTDAHNPIPSVSLSGTGIAPALSTSPSFFNNFGTQRVNTTSSPQTMTLTNTGNSPLSISGWVITTGFNQTNTCGTSLAANASCSVSVTFSPAAQGPVNGTLTLNSNLPGTPPSFALNGSGGVSSVLLSANSLFFGGQLVGTTGPAQTVVLNNTGNLPLSISSISASGDFAQTNNCSGSVAVSSSCTINVTFTPSASGPRSGTLSIADDAFSGSPQTVSLSGTGYTLSAAFNASTLVFAAQRVGTSSAAQNVTLTNTGTSVLSIGGFGISGDFAQTNNCPANLQPGVNCTVSVTFLPTTRGGRSGALVLSSNATGTAPSVALSGTGTAPLASLSTASLTFAGQAVSTTSPAQRITLTNVGDATLNVASIAASGDFAQTTTCSTTLAAGANCAINVTFTPTAAGTRSGALTITDDAFGGSPQSAFLSGTGIDFSLSASPASITVTHGSTANYTIAVNALDGSYDSAVGLSCSGSLPKGASCSFSPSSVTPGSGSASSVLKISTKGGGNGTPVGSYIITITGTSGAIQHATTVTLQVN